ncbi:hypothetical protein [Paractinoplanes hotanensis]|uniref:Uncharacterized protein n=1 Tax=Paractinoplanes hotanensis TaxID=2906497 RepID=A0ABT0XV68_9ACTN|nr:hypothetical protein [Actinoplanes hotanensis]MCM4076984.1 hypothetical protein [Actinoplanes hotanensis]
MKNEPVSTVRCQRTGSCLGTRMLISWFSPMSSRSAQAASILDLVMPLLGQAGVAPDPASAVSRSLMSPQ